MTSEDDGTQLAQTLDAASAPAAPAASVRVAGAVTQEPEPPPLVAGRYAVVGLLGVGGMGAVYRARDTRLDEMVALKLLRRELVEAPGMRARFHEEVRLARKVTHRNVARTFDIGEHEGGLLLTMELVDGESLAARLARVGALGVDEAIGVALDVCAGLEAAHAAGVIHRDLKPDNVLFAHDGRAVISDFGIACSDAGTGGPELVGTPAYMAPEQVEGAPDVDARADLYALGEVLYEMLTGARAWDGPSALHVAAARLASPPPEPRARCRALPDALAAVVLRLLARRREDRFARASDVARAIEAARGLPRAAGVTAPSPVAALPTSATRADRTVAVLPLKNLGVPAYVAEGLREDLVDTLTMTRGLRVRPCGVSEGGDARTIGRALGVQAVVEASLRAVPAGLRLGARVISVEDDLQIWAGRFERPAGEALSLADEAARAIAEALTADVEAPAHPTSPDPVGTDLYLQARAELRASYHASDRIRHAASVFDAALARAPRDPRVLAGAAIAHARVSFYGFPDARERADLAQDLAERAIALSPQLPEPWIALATLRLDAGDRVGMVRTLEAALRVAPRIAKAREMLGRVLLEAGEIEEAVALLGAALDLDPANDEPRWDLARAHALRGAWDASEAALARVLPTEAARVMRAWARARLALWQPRERWAAFVAEPCPGGDVVSRAALAFQHFLGEGRLRPEDDAFFEGLVREGSGRIRLLVFQERAELAAAEGLAERALDHVRAAVDGGLLDLAWMDACPLLAPLRAAGAWHDLRARVDERAERVRRAFREG